MVWTAPYGISLCQNEVWLKSQTREPSVNQIIRIGMDTSKHFFQLHGVDTAERPMLRRKLRRNEVLGFFAKLAPTVIGMEACGAGHYWARELRKLGHEVKLMAPQHVKAYVKRNKNDGRDAEGLCEAMSRPTMQFVPVKTEEQQAALMLAGVRQQLIARRTQLSNAIRGYAAEFGVTAAKGLDKIEPLLGRIAQDERLPELGREMFAMQGRDYARLQIELKAIEARLLAWHRANADSRRLAKIPGVGPIGATALVMKAPDPRLFPSGRHFAAWIGLTPKDHSTAAWRIGARRLRDQPVGGFAAPAEPELQEETDGRIDRSEVRDNPWDPLARKGRWSVWNSRRGKPSWPAATNRINRPDIWMQAIRSDHEKALAARGPSTYGSPRPVRNCALGGDDMERLCRYVSHFPAFAAAFSIRRASTAQ